MSKAAFNLVFICLLAMMFIAPFALPPVAAQAYYITISANGSECASVTVTGSFSGEITYTSFPDNYDLGPYGIDDLTVSVTAQGGYSFTYADDGSTTYLSNPFYMTAYNGMTLTLHFVATGGPTPTPPPSGGNYTYLFNGLYSEENINTYLGPVTVTAYYPNGSYGIGGRGVESFTVDESYSYEPYYQPMYFSYNLANYYGTNVTRQYWLSATEYSGEYYIFASSNSTLSEVVFNIRALGGLDFTGYFLIVKSIYSDQVIEKKIIDSQGVVAMNLKGYALYSVSIEGSDGFIYNYGYLSISSTPITLTLSALSFPADVLMQYKYLRIWASRPSSTEIQVSYEDTNEQTVSVVYDIKFGNGTVAYNNTHTGENSFADVWTSADADTTYYLTATVMQSTFGECTFSQVLLKDGASTSPVDLSFLGDWPVDPTQIFWAFIVFIVFGCFSVLNAYVGGFAGVVTATILSYLGWLVIPAGAIVAAFCIVFMAGIVYWKRRS